MACCLGIAVLYGLALSLMGRITGKQHDAPAAWRLAATGKED